MNTLNDIPTSNKLKPDKGDPLFGNDNILNRVEVNVYRFSDIVEKGKGAEKNDIEKIRKLLPQLHSDLEFLKRAQIEHEEIIRKLKHAVIDGENDCQEISRLQRIIRNWWDEETMAPLNQVSWWYRISKGFGDRQVRAVMVCIMFLLAGYLSAWLTVILFEFDESGRLHLNPLSTLHKLMLVTQIVLLLTGLALTNIKPRLSENARYTAIITMVSGFLIGLVIPFL